LPTAIKILEKKKVTFSPPTGLECEVLDGTDEQGCSTTRVVKFHEC